MKFILRLLINSVLVFLLPYVLHGIHVDSFLTAVIVAVAIAFINTVIKPLILLLTLPITILTLGLFALVINGILILLVSWIVPGFHVDGLLWAVAFSVLLSIISSIIHLAL